MATAGASVGRLASTGCSAPYQNRLAELRRRPPRSRRSPPGPEPRPAARRGRAQYYLSANVVKASEDKTFPGAIVASHRVALGAGGVGRRPEQHLLRLLPRGVLPATSTRRSPGCSPTATWPPRATPTRFLLLRQQQPDGSMPRNSLVNGKTAPDSFNIQLDEVAYPILMALQSGLGGDPQLWPHIRARRELPDQPRPVGRPGALGGAERLLAVDHRRRDRRAGRGRRHRQSTRRRGRRPGSGLPRPTSTSATSRAGRSPPTARCPTSRTSSGFPRPVTRTRRSVTTSATAARRSTSGRSSTPASSSWSGSVSCPPTTPTCSNSLPVVDKTIKVQTASGPGWLRYNGDGYGDCSAPTSGGCTTLGCAVGTQSDKGTGHTWPVLSGRARRVRHRHRRQPHRGLCSPVRSTRMSSGVGLVPEQIWDAPDLAASAYGTDPTTASIGFANGKPDGSAAPLTWGAASQVRLVADLTAGQVLETAERDRRIATFGTPSAPPRSPSPRPPTSPRPPAPSTSRARRHPARRSTSPTSAPISTAPRRTPRHRSGASGAFTVPATLVNGNNVLVVTSTAPERRHRPDGSHGRAATSSTEQLIYRPHRPDRRRQRPGKLRLPEGGRLPRRRVRPDRLPDLRHRRHGDVPGADRAT